MFSFARRIAPLFAGAALIATSAYAQEAKPDLDPAVWVVADEDTTIYLFGTVHALDGKGEWFNDEVKASFDASQELVMEIIQPEDPTAMQPLIMKYALDTSGKTLTSKLTEEHQKLLADQLGALGMPASALDQFKPFFAAVTLSVLQMQAAGINPQNGAETILTAAAKAKEMPLGEVETVEQQMQMLNSLPEDEQVRLLQGTLEEAEGAAEMFANLVAAWGRGDAEGVAEIMNEVEEDSEQLYKVLLTDRNARWAEWIDERLDQPGTVFMAVGAGHLAGKGSVQDYLKERGIETARVPAAE